MYYSLACIFFTATLIIHIWHFTQGLQKSYFCSFFRVSKRCFTFRQCCFYTLLGSWQFKAKSGKLGKEWANGLQCQSLRTSGSLIQNHKPRGIFVLSLLHSPLNPCVWLAMLPYTWEAVWRMAREAITRLTCLYSVSWIQWCVFLSSPILRTVPCLTGET